MADIDRARLRAQAEKARDALGPPVYGSTVLALLDALDAAERERDEAVREKVLATQTAQRLAAERDALAADARRYRVLCETHPGVLCFMGRDYRDKDELDAAIDEYIALDGAKGTT